MTRLRVEPRTSAPLSLHVAALVAMVSGFAVNDDKDTRR